jgi:predicted DNA-binding protein with PD1-like motif
LSGGADLHETLLDTLCQNHVKRGVIHILGSLSMATLGCLDHGQEVYVTRRVEGCLELGACLGFLAPLDGKPDLVVHAVFSDISGALFAGRLLPPTRAHAAGFIVHELAGEDLARRPAPGAGRMLLGP